MNESSTIANPLFMEVHARKWTGRSSAGGFSVDLHRDDQGKLTEETQAELKTAIQEFLPAEGNPECCCALSGSGISLRTLELPQIKNTSIQDLVRFQIEAEWPLPPEELVWGIFEWAETPSTTGETKSVRVTVGAIKKSLFEHYNHLLQSCGIEATWTLHSYPLGRLEAIRTLPKAWVFDHRASSSDFIRFEKGVPTLLRHQAWNDTELVPLAKKMARAIQNEEDANPEHNPIVVIGTDATANGCARELEQLLPGRDISSVAIPETLGTTSSSHAYHAIAGNMRDSPMIELYLAEAPIAEPKFDRRPLLRIAGLILLMGIIILLARRIEPSLRGSALNEQLENFKSEQKALPEIDRELTFLTHIHENTIPVKDLISLLAANAVSQLEIQSIEMSRDRRIQLRATLPQRAQPEDLRAKLFKTGWFEQVVLDEQTPDERKRKLTIRMSLKLHDHLKRPKLAKEKLGLKSAPKKSN